MYQENLEFAALQLMEKIGGGFASALAKAWMKADLTNQAKLRHAFGDLLEDYMKKVEAASRC